MHTPAPTAAHGCCVAPQAAVRRAGRAGAPRIRFARAPVGAAPAGARRHGRAHERDPVVERQLARDQAREPARDGRLDAGAVERAGEQRDEVERLDGLADPLGDLGRRHALGEQLAGAAVAAAGGERGRDQVAGAREPDQRLRAGAEAVGVAPDLGEDVPGGAAGGVQALALGRAARERGGVLRGARELDADRVVGLLADDARAVEGQRDRVRERPRSRTRRRARRPRRPSRARGRGRRRRRCGAGRRGCAGARTGPGRRAARGPWRAR